MFLARRQNLETLFVRAPLQDFDVDSAHAPTLHFEPARFAEIDRAGADQGRAVIVDQIFFLRIDNAKSRAKWKTRPIGGRASDVATGEIFADGVGAIQILGSMSDSRNTFSTMLRFCDRDCPPAE